MRAPRWARKLAARAATAGLLLGLFVAFVLFTPWGLTLALRILLAILHAGPLDARISFGDVDGGLLSSFRIEDVEMLDARGEPSVRVDALEADVAIRPLFSGAVQVDRLNLVRPRVWVDTSTPGTNWSLIAAPSPEEEDEDDDELPSVGIPLELSARVTASNLALIWVDAEHPDGRERVRELELKGSADHRDGAWDFSVDIPTAQAEGRPLSLSARATLTDPALDISRVEAETQGLGVTGSGQVRLRGGVSASLVAEVPSDWPPLPSGVLSAGGTARVDADIDDDGRISGVIGLESATSTATARVVFDPPRGRARLDLRVARLALREVSSSAPAGALAGDVRARARWPDDLDLARLSARLDASLSGDFDEGPDFEGLTATGQLRAGRARADASLDMPGIRLDARGRGRIAPALQPESVVLTATVAELQRFVPPEADVEGDLVLAVRAQRERGDRWRARLQGKSQQLRAGPWTGRHLDLAGTATGTGGRLGGAELGVSSRDNQLGPQRFGRFTVRARRPQPRVVGFEVEGDGGEPVRSVQLRGTLTATSGISLALDGGQIELGPGRWRLAPFSARVTSEMARWTGVEATSDLGFLQTEGAFDLKRAAGAAELRAQIDDLSSLPIEVEGGSVGVSADLGWTPEVLSGRVDVDARGVALEPMGRPVDVDLRAVADEALRVTAGARVAEGGSLRLELRATPPTPWTEPSAWIDWDRVQALEVGLERLSVERWLTERVAAAGRVDGRLVYDRAREILDLDLRGEALEAPGVGVPLGVSVSGGVDEAGTQLRVDSQVGEEPGPQLRATAGVTRDELSRLDRVDFEDRPLKVTGNLAVLPLPLVVRAAGLPRDWVETATGTVGLDLALSNAPDWSADLGIRVRGRLKSGSPDLDANLQLRLREDDLTATATVAGRGLGRVAARYGVEVAPSDDLWSRWRRGVVRVDVDELDLNGVRSLVVLPIDARGDIDADLEWDLDTDRGEASVRAPGLRVVQRLDSVAARLDATWTSTVTRLVGAIDAGADAPLELRHRFDRGPLAILGEPSSTPMEGGWRLTPLPAAEVFRDGYNRRRFGGLLTSTGTLAGTLGEPSLTGELAWRDARIGDQSFERFRAQVEQRPQTGLRGELDLVQRRGGHLGVEAVVGEGEGADARVEVEAAQFSIAFLSDLLGVATGATARAEGTLEADLRLAQRANRADLSGQLTLSDASLAVPGALPRLNQAKLSVTTAGDQVDVSLRGRSGARGKIELSSKVDVSDVAAPTVQGRLTGDRVEYLAGVLPLEMTFEIDLDGGPEDDHYALNVVIEKSRIIVTERDLADPRAPIRGVPDVVRVETFGVRPIAPTVRVPPLSDDPIVLSVNIRNGEPIRFRGTDSQAVATLDIGIDIREHTLRMSGAADVTDGTVTVFGREYRILKAIVRFTESHPPNPQLDVQLQHAFQRMTLTVIVGGRAGDPKVRFTGDPNRYDQSQLLAFFAGLSNPDQDGPTSDPGTQAVGAAAGILLGPVTKKVRQSLPIDTFDVSMGNGAPVVTVGKWITETLFIAYTWTSDSEATGDEQQGLVRWRFYPGWALEVIAGLNLQSADIFWVRRF